MSSDSDCASNVLLAFVSGVLVGSAIAILTTPKSGEQMRAELRGYGDQIRDRAEKGVEEVRDLAGKVKSRVRRSEEAPAEEPA